VFKYLLDSNYRSGLFVVPILLLAYWFLGMYYNFSIWYKINDKTYIGALISMGGALITFVVAVIMIPTHGLIAMAWAGLFCYFFMALSSYLSGRKYYPVKYPVGKMALYLGLALGIYFINLNLVRFFPASGWSQFIISTVLLCIYLLLIYTIDREKIDSWIGRS
jgi:O-antigen/teichoic acid export membrane protein